MGCNHNWIYDEEKLNRICSLCGTKEVSPSAKTYEDVVNEFKITQINEGA
jgi:hypothetical protein